ncbi:hypothetical protein C0J52_21077 [Blattella germanica]|nr:hypothetical protein C0J52_21077 [Blattella germanica]
MMTTYSGIRWSSWTKPESSCIPTVVTKASRGVTHLFEAPACPRSARILRRFCHVLGWDNARMEEPAAAS